MIPQICLELIRRPEFDGKDFSRGDWMIEQVAEGNVEKYGSPRQWIQWCLDHHMTFVANQLRTLAVP